MSTQYYLVSKATGGVVNAVLTGKDPAQVLAGLPNGDLLELKTEHQLSAKQLEDYEFWSTRP